MRFHTDRQAPVILNRAVASPREPGRRRCRIALWAVTGALSVLSSGTDLHMHGSLHRFLYVNRNDG